MRNKLSYRILINNKEIGYSELKIIDAGMGVLFGNFTPTSEYENYRPIFRLYIEAMLLKEKHEPNEEKLKEYFRKRDLLGITVEKEGGKTIPVTTVHIIDLSDKLGYYEVEIYVSKPDSFTGDLMSYLNEK
jgi:hypothetical protein